MPQADLARLYTSGDESLPAVLEHDDVTGVEVRCWVLEELEVAAVVSVEAVGRQSCQLRKAGGMPSRTTKCGGFS